MTKFSEGDRVTAFKGFNADMTCRGFQYEEGKTYEQDQPAVLCVSGFHAVTSPLDVFAYYSPAESVYRLVELGDVSEERESDSKVAGRTITIGAEIGIPGLVKAHVEVVRAGIKPDGKKSAHKTDDRSAASNTGDRSAASNTGDYSAASNTGNRSAASNTGDCSAASNTGDCSAASNPPLRSEDEFTQHTEDEHFRRGVALADARPVDEGEDDSYWRMKSVRFGGTDSEEAMTRAYFTMNARRFLAQHPHCRLGLVNEYGEQRELREEKTNG